MGSNQEVQINYECDEKYISTGSDCKHSIYVRRCHCVFVYSFPNYELQFPREPLKPTRGAVNPCGKTHHPIQCRAVVPKLAVTTHQPGKHPSPGFRCCWVIRVFFRLTKLQHWNPGESGGSGEPCVMKPEVPFFLFLTCLWRLREPLGAQHWRLVSLKKPPSHSWQQHDHEDPVAAVAPPCRYLSASLFPWRTLETTDIVYPMGGAYVVFP